MKNLAWISQCSEYTSQVQHCRILERAQWAACRFQFIQRILKDLVVHKRKRIFFFFLICHQIWRAISMSNCCFRFSCTVPDIFLSWVSGFQNNPRYLPSAGGPHLLLSQHPKRIQHLKKKKKSGCAINTQRGPWSDETGATKRKKNPEHGANTFTLKELECLNTKRWEGMERSGEDGAETTFLSFLRCCRGGAQWLMTVTVENHNICDRVLGGRGG